jgi:hypothetical protein
LNTVEEEDEGTPKAKEEFKIRRRQKDSFDDPKSNFQTPVFTDSKE